MVLCFQSQKIPVEHDYQLFLLILANCPMIGDRFLPVTLQKRSPYINISSRSELFHTSIIFTLDQDNAYKELQAH